jgi:hypothetical protein
MACSSTVVVFAHAHVLLAMECVFHLPMVSNCLSRLRRWHLPARGIGYGIGYFMVGLTRAMMKAGSLYSEDLTR